MADRLSELSPNEFRCLLNGLALMSQLYWGPTPELCQELVRVETAQELMELGDLLHEESGQAARDLVGSLQAIKDPVELYSALEPMFVGTFVSAPGGGVIPLYHSCYQNEEGLMMGEAARMMQMRLAEAGVDLEAITSEPPDHLAVELEYLFLLLEQAYTQDAPRLLNLARDFAAQELLPWLEEMQRRLPQADQCLLYPSATELLLAMVRLTAG